MAYLPSDFRGRVIDRPFGSELETDGSVHHLTLPPVCCEQCGTKWDAAAKLPIVVPTETLDRLMPLFRSEKVPIGQADRITRIWAELFGASQSILPPKPVSLREYSTLAKQVAALLDLTAEDLAPGLQLVPGYWNVRPAPIFDFYYPNGTRIVVSQRTKEVLESIAARGVAYFPLLLDDLSDGASYFELTPLCTVSAIRPNQGCEACRTICTFSSRQSVDDFPYTPDILFSLPTTIAFLVTERVAQAIECHNLTHVDLRRLNGKDFPLSYDSQKFQKTVLSLR